MMTPQGKKLSTWRLVLLSAVSAAIDLGYAVEGSYTTPYLLAIGLRLKYASLALSLSPFLGMMFQAYLGSASDECSCYWGRRRPFMILFGVTAFLSIGLAPHVFSLFSRHEVQIFVAILCAVGFDFSISALVIPSRAYMLDVVPSSQCQYANFIYVVLAGKGATLGYALGGIDWSTVLDTSSNIRDQVKIVFSLVAVVALVCVVMSVCSVTETPYSSTRTDKYEGVNSKAGCSPTKCCSTLSETLNNVRMFVYYMSGHMWLLCLWMTLASLGMFAFDYFFTVFMGTVVYNGDPMAAETTPSYKQYAEGVRVGSLGLALAGLCSAILAVALDYLTKWVRLKLVFVFFLIVFVVSCSIMYCVHDIHIILVLVVSYGPFLALLFSVPFILVPVYKEHNMLFRKPWPDQPESVEGKATSVIQIAMMLGQSCAGLLVGPIVETAGDKNVLILVPNIAVVLAIIVILLNQMPEQKPQTS